MATSRTDHMELYNAAVLLRNHCYDQVGCEECLFGNEKKCNLIASEDSDGLPNSWELDEVRTIARTLDYRSFNEDK